MVKREQQPNFASTREVLFFGSLGFKNISLSRERIVLKVKLIEMVVVKIKQAS